MMNTSAANFDFKQPNNYKEGKEEKEEKKFDEKKITNVNNVDNVNVNNVDVNSYQVPPRFQHILGSIPGLRDIDRRALLAHMCVEASKSYSMLYKQLDRLCKVANASNDIIEKRNVYAKISMMYHDYESMKKSLAERIRDYYYLKFDIRGRSHILKHPSIALNDIATRQLNSFTSDDVYSLITAWCQAGKTFIVLPIVFVALCTGVSVVTVFDTIKSKEQFRKRYLAELEILKQTGNDIGKELAELCQNRTLTEKVNNNEGGVVDMKLNADLNDVLYRDGYVRPAEKKRFNHQLKKALSGEEAKLVMMVSHYKQCERLNEAVTELAAEGKRRKFVLIFDEAHDTSGYRRFGEDNEGKYNRMVWTLKSHALKIYDVDATCQDILFCNPFLKCKNVVYSPPTNEYIDPYHYKYRLIDERRIKEEIKNIKRECKENKVQYNSRIHDPILDCELRRILDYKSTHSGIIRKNYNAIAREGGEGGEGKRCMVTDVHPTIILLRDERMLERMNNIFKMFQGASIPHQHLTDETVRAKWFVITFQGEGIRVGHPALINTPSLAITTLTGEEVIRCNESDTGEFFFEKQSGVEIGDVYQWLADRNRDLRTRFKFCHILTIAYDMACQSTSFTSHYNKGDNYHLTDIYITSSHNSHSTTLIQATQRIGGNHNDNIQPTVHCTRYFKEQFINAFTTHNLYIAEVTSNVDQDANVTEVVRRVAIHQHVVPKHFNAFKNNVDIFRKNMKYESNYSSEEKKCAAFDAELISTDPKRYMLKRTPDVMMDDVKKMCERDIVVYPAKKVKVTGRQRMVRAQKREEEKREEKKEEKKEEEGKYTIIDKTKLSPTTNAYSMIDNVMSLLDDNMIYEPVRVSWINEQLVATCYPNKTTNDIHGDLWTAIRRNTRLVRTNKKQRNSLVCWKENSILMIQLIN